MIQDQGNQWKWKLNKIEVQCLIVDAINVNQMAINHIVYGTFPWKYLPNCFLKVYKLSIRYYTNKLGYETTKIMFVV
jgi:hypothetical protein